MERMQDWRAVARAAHGSCASPQASIRTDGGVTVEARMKLQSPLDIRFATRRQSADMAALAHQIDNGPVAFPLLNLFQLQMN